MLKVYTQLKFYEFLTNLESTSVKQMASQKHYRTYLNYSNQSAQPALCHQDGHGPVHLDMGPNWTLQVSSHFSC